MGLNAARAPKILGLDISLTKTGVATPAGTTLTIKGGKGDDRLVNLYEETCYLVATDVDLAIIEDLPTHAMSAGLTGQAQGVVRLALRRYSIPYVTVAPATLKKAATGSGKATKLDMVDAAVRLRKESPQWAPTDDEADAYLLRWLGLERLAGRQLDAKVDWAPWADAGWLE